MSNQLARFNHAQRRTAIGNAVYGKAGLAIDASTNDVETANAFDYSIGGIMYTLAAQTAIDISGLSALTLDDAAAHTERAWSVGSAGEFTDIPDDYENLICFAVDASGNIRVLQGPLVALGGTVEAPEVPDDHVVFAGVHVKNESGSTFVVGTTGLDTSGVTDTYYDFAYVPISV